MEEKIRLIAEKSNLSLYGVSDITEGMDFICTQGGQALRKYNRCITIGIALPSSIINAITNDNDIFAVPNYLYAYQQANQILAETAYTIAVSLQDYGFEALPIPPATYPDTDNLASQFSHKIGAHLAGLGWIGKSGMLISQKFGPNVRLCSILTDAPLKVYSGELLESKCNNCKCCIDVCPVSAYKNREFDVRESREMRFDAFKCNDYHRSMENNGKIALCGLCIAACPHGPMV
ncbi:MAG: epoxyqueuosine reductase [Epulopiscium sp.]|nr:epoxyqueuosine reductase [Candidatus Epulonipiscium sp.]